MSSLPLIADVAEGGLVPPAIDPDSRWWWEALEAGELLLPRCDNCAKAFFPPTPRCPECGSPGWRPEPAGGDGELYSWVVTHHPFDPAFASDVPYTVVVVTLAEGPRLAGRLLGEDPGELVAGTAMQAVTYRVAGQALLGFVSAGGEQGTRGRGST